MTDPLKTFLNIDTSNEGAIALYNRAVDLLVEVALQRTVCNLLDRQTKDRPITDEDFTDAIADGLITSARLVAATAKEFISKPTQSAELVRQRIQRSSDANGGTAAVVEAALAAGVPPEYLSPESLN